MESNSPIHNKRKLISLALTLAVAHSLLSLAAMGQGTVCFNNRDFGAGIDAPVFWNEVGGAKVDGTDPLWRAALLGGLLTSTPVYAGSTLPNGGTTLSMLASPTTGATWVNFRTGAAAGYVAVGSDCMREIPGVDWGGHAMVQMVVWYGDFDTWNDAYAAYGRAYGGPIAWSEPLTVTLADGPLDPNLTRLVGLQSFSVIPEPCALPLAALGTAILLLARRCASY